MPYAENGGVRIYYETEGAEKPSLVMAHGGTGSLEDWRKHGYTKPFLDDFRLILFDARGHGRSDRPHEASIDIMADDVIAVLDATGVAEANYWGYSMGSVVGLNLAVRYISRFSSFIIGGISPYRMPESILKPILTARDAFLEQLSYPPAERKPADPEADIAILNALIDRQPLTNEDLARIDVPCLFYCGDKDPFHAGAEESIAYLPRAGFVSLPGVNHASVKAEQVVPYVGDFLAEVNGTRRKKGSADNA